MFCVRKEKSCVNKFVWYQKKSSSRVLMMWKWSLNYECWTMYVWSPLSLISQDYLVPNRLSNNSWLLNLGHPNVDVCQPYTQSKSELPLLWTRVDLMPLGYADVQSQCMFHGPIKPMGSYQRYLSISKRSPSDMTGDFPLRPINNLILTINSGGLWKALRKVKAGGNGSSFRFRWSKADPPRFALIIPGHKATPFSRCCSTRGLRGRDEVKGGDEDGLGRESAYGREWWSMEWSLSAFTPRGEEEIKDQAEGRRALGGVCGRKGWFKCQDGGGWDCGVNYWVMRDNLLCSC